VYFRKNRFNHAFYESEKGSTRKKDVLSAERVQRIDWIRATLESATSDLLQGWITKEKRYDPTRRVAVVQENYVVVIRLSLDKESGLFGDFVTAIVMDSAGLAKVRKSPKWTREGCLEALAP
jgi:hypothetical protein